MKAQFLIAMFATVTSFASHAVTHAKYVCHDEKNGQKIVEFGIQPGCTSSFGCAYVLYGAPLPAYGSYQYQKDPCPSRLCGNFNLQLKARTSAMSPRWPVEYISLGVSNSSVGAVTGLVQFQLSGGRAPQVFSVVCKPI